MSEKFNSPCLYFNLRKTARLVGQFYDAYFRQIGLRGTQYSLLVAIARLDGPSIGGLSEALGLEQSTVTRNIDLLVRKAYVRADPDPADSRRKLLSVTASGRAKISEAGPVWQEAQAGLIKKLGRGEADRLNKILNQVMDQLN